MTSQNKDSASKISRPPVQNHFNDGATKVIRNKEENYRFCNFIKKTYRIIK